jgi:16S rRNA (cytosine967-C5)-methyltransferase
MQHTLADSLALAAVVIGRVLKGESLNRALTDLHAEGQLKSAAQAHAYAALRDYGHADAMLDQLLTRQPTPSLRGLLLAAVAELQSGGRQDHAVVDQAVQAAARVAPRSAQAAKGLVNAVLRNWLRRRGELEEKALATEPGRYRHPQWWIERVRAAWPMQWQAVLEAGNVQAPMTLRVNRRRLSGRDYAAQCAAQGIDAVLLGQQAVLLSKPLPVERLPGFAEGVVSVQDWAAQLAAPLLDVHPGMRVLDACAAPGGKTAHMAELADCELTALDVDGERLARVHDNLRRLGLRARVLQADALQAHAPARDAPGIGGGYERILLDAPCSASGVVRRHPDIKWLRRDTDVAALARTQDALLAALWPRLAPGGRLLYATCSLFPDENAQRISAFAAAHPDALCLPTLPIADNIAVVAGEPGCQILPGPDSDGFFYALLEKKA